MDAWHTEPKVVVLVAVGGWGECGGGFLRAACVWKAVCLPVWGLWGQTVDAQLHTVCSVPVPACGVLMVKWVL